MDAIKKTNESFKQKLEYELWYRATDDVVLEKKLSNPNKNMDECVEFILGEIAKRIQAEGLKAAAINDEEVYGMAIHYFDEENIKVEKFNGECFIAGNIDVELTEEEKKEIKEKALHEYQEREIQAMRERDTKKKGTPSTPQQAKEKKEQFVQTSLF